MDLASTVFCMRGDEAMADEACLALTALLNADEDTRAEKISTAIALGVLDSPVLVRMRSDAAVALLSALSEDFRTARVLAKPRRFAALCAALRPDRGAVAIAMLSALLYQVLACRVERGQRAGSRAVSAAIFALHLPKAASAACSTLDLAVSSTRGVAFRLASCGALARVCETECYEAERLLGSVVAQHAYETSVAVQSGALRVFRRACASEALERRHNALWAIGNVAGGTAENARSVLECEGLVELACAQALRWPECEVTRLDVCWLLLNLTSHEPGSARAHLPVVGKMWRCASGGVASARIKSICRSIVGLACNVSDGAAQDGLCAFFAQDQ